MLDPLIRLTYVSTFHPFVTQPEILALVADAAASNKDRNISGVIAIDGDRVCQILEGPGEAVATLFAVISRDSRHHAVIELDRREIHKLGFESWGMVRRSMADMIQYALTTN